MRSLDKAVGGIRAVRKEKELKGDGRKSRLCH
jgi:hypothetical protein